MTVAALGLSVDNRGELQISPKFVASSIMFTFLREDRDNYNVAEVFGLLAISWLFGAPSSFAAHTIGIALASHSEFSLHGLQRCYYGAGLGLGLVALVSSATLVTALVLAENS